jgi:beta-phosphoglucomutase-like phosphatase (HAD superfamily)
VSRAQPATDSGPRIAAAPPAAVRVLLCDADGNLFPSEEPAFVASAVVTNRVMSELGVVRRYTPTELRLATTGRNFRTTVVDLAAAHGIPLSTGGHPGALSRTELERWVDEERRAVTAHLARELVPDPAVAAPLARLQRRYGLAAVSSSAAARLDTCFEATGLAELFPPHLRFSAEDSLPVPTGKPDPAIYRFAARELGIEPMEGLAIEDSVPGVMSADAAGHPTVGNVMFVPAGERAARAAALRDAGAQTVVASWRELEELLA